jgi:hypothetical protein
MPDTCPCKGLIKRIKETLDKVSATLTSATKTVDRLSDDTDTADASKSNGKSTILKTNEAC